MVLHPARTHGAARSAGSLSRRRVLAPCALIVTRNAHFRRWACEQLRESRFEVLIADNGLDALMVVDREPPQVIVVDHALPWFGVICLLNRVRSDATTASIPVFLVATRAALPFVAACRRLGVTVLGQRLGELRAILAGPARPPHAARLGVEAGPGCPSYQRRP